MLAFTDTARQKVLEFIDMQESDGAVALRIEVAEGGSPFAPLYEFSLSEESPDEDDFVFDGGGFDVHVDSHSAEVLRGSTVEFLEREDEAGFVVQNPNVKPLGSEAPSGPLAERVRQVIEERINPGVAAHGGQITLVDVRDDVAYITMGGGCQGCGMARVTLRQGVERMIREAVPEIAQIEDVTDHMAGTNPYYAST